MVLVALAAAGCLPEDPSDGPTDSHATTTTDTGTPTTTEPGDPCEVPGAICTRIGDGSRGFNGDGLDADQSWLNLVTAIAFDPMGRTVFTDFANLRIRRLEPDGTVYTVAGSGFHANGIEGVAILSPLENPSDVTFCPSDTSGGFYISELHAARIDYIDGDGILHFYAGIGGEVGYDGDGGDAKAAHLSESVGLTCGDDGTIYIADTDNQCIRAVHPDGTIVTLAGMGIPGYQDGAGSLAQFNRPQHLAYHDGGLYLAELGNHAIRRIDVQTGEVTTVAGNGTAGFSGDDGPATSAQLRGPVAVQVTSDGAIWIADSDNSVIRRVDPAGIITTVAGTPPGPDVDEDGKAIPHAGYSGDGGPALEAYINWPNGLYVDEATNDLWIADTLNSVVRRVRGDKPAN